VGAHYVQLNVYGLDDKLIAKSDAVVFNTRASPETTTPVPTSLPATPTTAAAAATTVTTITATTATTAALTPTVTISNDFANIRSGPGTNYDIVGQLNQNDSANVRGKAQAGDFTWYQIVFAKGPNGLGWVRGDLVSANAAVASVAAVAPPVAPTSPPAPPPPTAAPPTVPAATPTPSDPCVVGSPDWRGQNPNYPFCAKQDPTWADPQDLYLVFDNGRDIPLSFSWNIYGAKISRMDIHFDQDNNNLCGFNKQGQTFVNQQVQPAGSYNFNVNQFPYGGTYRVYWTVTLVDGRTVIWGEKKLCIR
jgi:uncharacterized protein YraI